MKIKGGFSQSLDGLWFSGEGFYLRLLASEARQEGFVGLVGSLWASLASWACPSVHMSACAIVDSQRVHQAGAGSGTVAWGQDNHPHHEVMREKVVRGRFPEP